MKFNFLIHEIEQLLVLFEDQIFKLVTFFLTIFEGPPNRNSDQVDFMKFFTNCEKLSWTVFFEECEERLK